MEGHAVERKGYSSCTLPEKLNDQTDKSAKQALVSALKGGHVVNGDFPFELVTLKLSGIKVCSSPRLAIESDWGYRSAQWLFDSKDIVKSEDFHLVWWTGLGLTTMKYPKMYRVWLTKHVS